ncbi:MAG: hypothetical protein IPK26_25710 [Planctomycetes bacterium]|nr:hypothetical protein [Planctomycetota bacterium]
MKPTPLLVLSLVTAGLAQTWTVVSPVPEVYGSTDAVDRQRDVRLRVGHGPLREWDGGGWRVVGDRPQSLAPTLLVFDEAARRYVAVGNELNGMAAWSSPATPQQWTRHGAIQEVLFAGAWDPVRQQVLAIGMRNGVFGTFAWNGATWVRLTTAHQPTVQNLELVTDPLRNRIVLFSGMDVLGQPVAQTWEWDGVDWQQIAVSASPSWRWQPAMGFDEASGAMLLFGGVDSIGPLRDTWQYVGGNWTALTPPTSPSPDLDPRLHWSGTHRQLILTLVNETWAWNGADWRQVAGGSAVTAYACVNDLARQRLVAAAGPTGWAEFDGRIWTFLSGSTAMPVPTSRSLAWLPNAPHTLVFGTWVHGQPADETWTWDGQTWQSHVVSRRPSARTSHGMAWHPASAGIVLHGGVDNNGALTDTWLWNGTSWLDLTANSPLPPVGPCEGIGLDLPSGAIIHGGVGPATWMFGQNGWQSVATTTVPGLQRGQLAAGAEPGSLRFRMFGRFDGQQQSWRWTGGDWQMVAHPVDFQIDCVGVDPGRQRLLAIGRDHHLEAVDVASATPRGVGCGSPMPVLDTFGGEPRLGVAAFGLRLGNVAPRTLVVIAFDTVAANLPLPGGCAQLLANPQVAGFVLANDSGWAVQPVVLPMVAALRGVVVESQGFALAAGGPLLGVAVASAALSLRLGD